MVVPTPTIVIGIANSTTIAKATATMVVTAAEPSSDMTYTADKNCITPLDGAVGAHGITRSKMGSANRIVASEIHLESRPPKLAASLILPFGFVG